VRVQAPSASTFISYASAVGDRVRHPAFGEGRVTAVSARPGDYEVVIQFAQGTPHRFLVSKSRLERV
jgi:hypothetical protein